MVQVEDVEAANLNPITVHQLRMDGLENFCYRHFSIILLQLWIALGE